MQPPNQPPWGPPGPPQGYPQQPGYPQQQPYPQQQQYGYPQQGYPQQPHAPQPKKSNAGKIIGCLAVVFVLVIGGAVGAFLWYRSAQTEKMAHACSIGTKSLSENAGSRNPDSFMKLLALTLESCSAACDKEDAPSCAALDDHLKKLCSVDKSMCTKLCTTVDSPSLKTARLLAQVAIPRRLRRRPMMSTETTRHASGDRQASLRR